jgi:nitrogen PTS system EIIA component
MQLTVRDVSSLLNISERTIYRWIKQGAIPVYRIHDQYRFNRSELLEWVSSQKLEVSPDIFKEPGDATDEQLPTLSQSLKTGGIYYRVTGNDKESVLRSVIEMIRLPEDIDREFLLKVFLAREELASTGIGDGIAIPHVRNPIVLNVPSSFIALCFLENPIDFKSLDGKPVHCLFLLISATARIHLHLLSKLVFALKDSTFKAHIINQASRDDIIHGAEQVEKTLHTIS